MPPSVTNKGWIHHPYTLLGVIGWVVSVTFTCRLIVYLVLGEGNINESCYHGLIEQRSIISNLLHIA